MTEKKPKERERATVFENSNRHERARAPEMQGSLDRLLLEVRERLTAELGDGAS